MKHTVLGGVFVNQAEKCAFGCWWNDFGDCQSILVLGGGGELKW